MTWLEYCRAVYERRIYLARIARVFGKDSAMYKLAATNLRVITSNKST